MRRVKSLRSKVTSRQSVVESRESPPVSPPACLLRAGTFRRAGRVESRRSSSYISFLRRSFWGQALLPLLLKLKIRQVSIIHFSLFISLILTGCYQPMEGCLDAKAVNFEFEADKACSNCCEYPVIKLDFQHKIVKGDQIDNLVFNDSVYYDIAGNPFRVNSLQFYISELHFIRSDGTELGIEEEIDLPVFNNQLQVVEGTFEDNFVLVNPSTFSTYQVGTFRKVGTFDKLSFRLGLSSEANRVVNDILAESFPDHPLAEEEMYLNFDDGYIFNRIELTRDTLTGTESSLLTAGSDLITQKVELPIIFEAIEGFNIQVTLLVDYQTWFKDIHVEADSDEVLMQKIVANMAESFSVVAIGL